MAIHSGILAWVNPEDRGAWRGTVHGVAESIMTEQLTLTSRMSALWGRSCVCLFTGLPQAPRTVPIPW